MTMPRLQPVIRQHPEEFVVEEIPLYRASGDGPHVWVEIEKRRLTTDEAVGHLCDAFAFDRRMVGYAGRKDRHAVTRQWLSLPRIDRVQMSDLEQFERPGLRILRATFNRQKLRLGDLRGNRFCVVVRERETPSQRESAEGEAQAGPVSEPALEEDAIEQFLAKGIRRAETDGLCNRFGEQRFGRRGDNAKTGGRIFRGEQRPREHRLARLLLSAFQSSLFHRTLELRCDHLRSSAGVEDELAAARTLIAGDVLFHHTSGFVARLELGGEEPSSEESEQVARGEVSPTGPLYGPEMWAARGAAGAIERAVLAEAEIDPDAEATARVLRRLRLRGARRPFRVPVRGLAVRLRKDLLARSPVVSHAADAARTPERDSGREFRFQLPPGAYATVLLEQLYGGLKVLDAAREG